MSATLRIWISDMPTVIPNHTLYTIDENAVVRLASTNEIIPEYINHRGKRAVRIRGKSHKTASQPLARLMLITFKPLGPDKDPDWLSITYHNDNEADVSINNLDWNDSWYHPAIIPGMNVQRDTWIPLYGYPQLQLRIHDKHILFRKSETWEEVGAKIGTQGYLYVNIPKTQVSLSVHKAVALTLLPHPIDVDKLVVNHRDSDITNNLPSNLEWATYTQNNFHAFSEGPRGETVRKIRLKHVKTSEEVVVAGLQEMSRYLDILPQDAHQVLCRRKQEGRPYKGYLCKYEDDPRTWEELAASPPRGSELKTLTITVKNMYTGEVNVYRKLYELCKKEEIRDFMVERLIKSKIMIPWRGRCFQVIDDVAPPKWPNYPKEILDVYANIFASGKPIVVIDEYYVTRYYSGATEWSNEDRDNRCDPAVLSRLLKKNKGQSCNWKNWTFRYVDLSKYIPV
jgi:hypothetical protein